MEKNIKIKVDNIWKFDDQEIIIDNDIIQNPDPELVRVNIKESINYIISGIDSFLDRHYSEEHIQAAKEIVSYYESKKRLTKKEKEDYEWAKLFLQDANKRSELKSSKEVQEIIEKIEKRKSIPHEKKYDLMGDDSSNEIAKAENWSDNKDGIAELSLIMENPPVLPDETNTFIMMTMGNDEIQYNKKIDQFDIAVCQAIANLYWDFRKINEKCLVTPRDIWKKMYGKTEKARPSSEQIKKVSDSVDKMRFARTIVDFTGNVKYMTVDNEKITVAKRDTYFIKAEKVSFETEKGKVLEGYFIMDEPVLFKYNREKNSLITVPYVLLDTTGDKNIGSYTAEFTNFLLQWSMRRIKMSVDKDILEIETVYKKTGLETPEERADRNNHTSDNSYKTNIRKMYKSDREKIESILNTWIEKGEVIKEYKIMKKGSSITGYEIMFKVKKQNKK